MSILHISAFSDNGQGGNPAGVLITDRHPEATEMQRIAHELGYSETVFAAPEGDAWRVRYFAPEGEVPFCGHATIALGAALALKFDDECYALKLNAAHITVTGRNQSGQLSATLQSPLTQSSPLLPKLREESLRLFGITESDLDVRLSPAVIQAGARHVILPLNSRQALADMSYDFNQGQKLMREASLTTIMLAYAETTSLFHVRNAFASGGVMEDPATGAAAAAFAGYLRDVDWPDFENITLIQGEDMGARSVILVRSGRTKGSSVEVTGQARIIA